MHGTGGIKAGGRGIVQRCFFGATMGYNDAMDFTGGNRNLGQPIVQFYHNVFIGGSDDLLDLDGTDAWIEGNLFLHCHANGTPDSASAVSGGSDSGQTSEITLIDNVFFDCDQAATAKEGNFFTLLNNTIVHMNHAGGLDTTAAVVNVRDFPSGGSPTAFGRGHYLEGNVITDAEGLVRNYDASQVAVTFNRNLLPTAWTGPGAGNQIAPDPQLVHLPAVAETRFTNWTSAQVLWDWLSPLPGSPARGVGPGGSDWGARRLSGVRLAGIPAGKVRESSVSINVGPNLNAAEASLPAAGWPQGAGYIAYRWRLDDGPWSVPTPIRTPISLSGISAGSHQLEVAGQRDSGLYQDDPVLGIDAGTTKSAPWTIDPLAPPGSGIQRLQLSEILAGNDSIALAPGFTPDLVEIHNPTDSTLVLTGIGLTTSAKNPFRFTFPAGTTLNAHGYLVLLAENSPPPGIPQMSLGFNLNRYGDSLYLFSPATNVIDQVTFGGQLPDYSIGRRPDGEWSLGLPSFGEPNRTTPLGSPSGLRLNEWLASHLFLAAEDYIEIYNTDPRPVDLGGLFLSQAPASPQQYKIAPLNFIAGHGFRIFLADGRDQSPDHLNFTLDREAGYIGLSAGDEHPIDVIIYGPQRVDVPEGRKPNGGGLITFLSGPSPGASNPGSNIDDPGSTNIVTITLPFIAMTNRWRYSQSGELAARWREQGYDDTTWAAGAALFYVETSALPAPKNTPLTLGKNTYYFRTHFNIPTDLPELRLLLTSIIDDGAVFWLNGHELHRLGMDSGAVTYGTLANRTVGNAVVEGPFEVPTTWLLGGDNVLAVEVHQSVASSSDVVFGAALDATYRITNSVVGPTNSIAAAVLLNEILSDNRSHAEDDGSIADWLELYNSGDAAVDLGGWSLTDDLVEGRKYSFAAGTRLSGNAYLRLLCSGSLPASPTNTGFGLHRTGGAVFLLQPVTRGGRVGDSLTYGLQVRDISLGRVPDGSTNWTLTLPTPARANQALPAESAITVRLNEWLADNSAGDDWLELYNTGPAPVALSGWHLSDDPSQPMSYTFPPYSYLGTGLGAWVRLFASGSLHPPDAGQLNFKLNKKGDELIFSDPAGRQVDAVAFQNQQTDVSEGRVPDGIGAVQRFITLPTPGAKNAPDADHDGIDDDWELQHGLDPKNAGDALQDSDGDGVSNRDEYRAGTDPRDPLSRLKLDVDRLSAGTIRLRFTLPPEHHFVLQATERLDVSWQDLLDLGNVSFPRTTEASDTHAGTVNQRFYRLLVQP